MYSIESVKLTKKIGHDVITHHETDGNNQPKDALKSVLNAEVGRGAKEEEGDMCPGELGEGREMCQEKGVD